MVRLLVFPLLTAVVALASGCSECDRGAADCTLQVRYDGVEYDGSRRIPAKRVGDEVGRAELADCDDVGCDAAGTTYPDDPQLVTVYRVEGRNAEEALAWEYRDGKFALLTHSG